MNFLKEKWSFWFSLLDVNHDGKITRADVDLTLDNFPKVAGLTEEAGKLAVENIEKWWNTCILKGRDQITQEDFLQDLEKQFTDSKETFIQAMRGCMEDIIGVVDTDKTKDISLDNYVKAFKVWGHDDEELLRKAFELYKPDHDMIPIQEYTDDWVTFVTNDDPSKPDVVLDTYKAGLM